MMMMMLNNNNNNNNGNGSSSSSSALKGLQPIEANLNQVEKNLLLEQQRKKNLMMLMNFTGRKVNRKILQQETADFAKILKKKIKTKSINAKVAKESAIESAKANHLVEERQKHENEIERLKLMFIQERLRLIRINKGLKRSIKLAESEHRSRLFEIKKAADVKIEAAKAVREEEENTNWKDYSISYPDEGIKEFNVDERTLLETNIAEPYPYPKTSITKLAGESQNHLLVSWSFMSQFGDIMGFFPRKKK